MTHSKDEIIQAQEAIDEIELDSRNTRTMVDLILDYKQRRASNAIDRARVTALDMRNTAQVRERALNDLISIAEGIV